jgi:ribosomal protein L14E/L6E/L27E
MVVVGFCDGRYVLVSDGDRHPTARPKRKNIRHLAPATAVQQDIAEGRPIGDDALRAWLLDVARPEEA